LPSAMLAAPGPARRGSRRRTGLLAALLLAAAPAAAAPPVEIVILPIVVHSADPDAGYVSEGISDMLASRLEQTGKVEVEQVSDPEAATTRLGEALRRGQALGGDYVLFGAFTQFGDGASLDVHCIPLDVASEAEAAAARRIFVQSGAMGEIIPKLDEIVDRVAVYAKLVPDPAGSAGQPAAVGAAPAGAPSEAPGGAAGGGAAALRDLAERLEALEEAVFGGGASADAGAAEPAPES